jgi:Zn-dependent peptidase ImmA (M78 family)/transcriptional regulator with XRE-family HTH domain
MTERTKAMVEKELLVWARKTASLTLEAASAAAHIPMENIEAWEAGEGRPSIPELKKLANAYRRPLSVFFLPEPPQDFQPLRDFRRLADAGQQAYSRELAFEIRAAQERRAVAAELAEALGDEVVAWNIDATLRDNPEQVAQVIRERLSVTVAQQSRWGEPGKAFRAWRDAIEANGVLVSVLGGAHHQVPVAEVRGFALAERPLPMIVVNGKDRGNGRVFTLMHELAHVVLGVSAIENEIEPGALMPPPIRSIETFCNKVAAAVLMPKEAVLAEPLAAAKNARSVWDEAEIVALARRYSVSREALLVRLAVLGLADPVFVEARRQVYARQYQDPDGEEVDAGNGFAPYATQVVSHIGRGFARLVIQAYHSRAVTLSTASGYLGTQAKYVGNIERLAFGAPA